MNKNDIDDDRTHTLDNLPDYCTSCGGWVDHWVEAMVGERVRVGWDCDFCDASDEWHVGSPTGSTLNFSEEQK